MDDRTEEPHHVAADGLLTQGGSDHENRAAEIHELARVGQSGPHWPAAVPVTRCFTPARE